MKKTRAGAQKTTKKVTKKPRPDVKKSSEETMKLVDAHPDHDKHLCHIAGLRNMKTIARLSRNAEHICFLCGRAARYKKNLCYPVKI